MQATAAYGVDGMTCGHCAGVVTSALQGLPGVTDVLVDLTPGGVSTVTVTSTAPVSAEDVDTAVRQAGYRLA
jgi:copper chaperone